MNQELKEKLEQEINSLKNDKKNYEEQLNSLQEENQKLLDTLIRHSKERANSSIS